MPRDRIRLPQGPLSIFRDCRGAVYIWVAFGLIGLMGFAAIAIDMGYFYVLRNQAQIAADGAALASVVELPDHNAVRAVAKDYADKNMPTSSHGTVLKDSDIVVGNWEGASFVAGGAPENAVKVTVRRSQSNDNDVPTFFGRVLGFNSVDITTSAVAINDEENCFINNVYVNGFVQWDQNAVVEAGACVYGRKGMHFDRDGTVEPDAYVGVTDESTFTHDQGFSADPDSIVEMDLSNPLLNNVPQLIDDIENGSFSPEHIDTVVVTETWPESLDPGTAYVINNDVEVDKEINGEDVLIAVRGNIEWGQKGSILNTHGTCPNGEPAIGIVATGDILLSQSARAEGVQLITDGNFTLNQDSVFSGSAAISGDAQLDQSPILSACEDTFETPKTVGARLVQ